MASAFLPYMIGDQKPELIRVFPEPIAFNTGYIVYHESVRNTVRVLATVEALVEFFERHAALFTGGVVVDGGSSRPGQCS